MKILKVEGENYLSSHCDLKGRWIRAASGQFWRTCVFIRFPLFVLVYSQESLVMMVRAKAKR